MKSFIVSIFTLAVTLSSVVAKTNSTSNGDSEKKPKVCNALAMAGGGTYGAYEAGALWGMLYTDIYDKEKFEYHVVTGISAGSINAGGVALFPIGEEEEMVNVLSDKWSKLTTPEVYVDWKPLGIVTGINSKSGVFDTSPLQTFLENFFDERGGTIHRKVGLGAVDANSGMYRVVNETDPEIIRGIMSSAAIPAVFPTILYPELGLANMDGGAVYGVDVFTAVKRCRELVDDDSQINLDVIMCGSTELGSGWTNRNNAMANFMKFMQIKDYNKGIADVFHFIEAFPNVNWRYYVQPSGPFPGNALNADNDTVTWPVQMMGRLDGENVVKSGEGFYFDSMRNYARSPELKKEFPEPKMYVEKLVTTEYEKFKQERRHQNPVEEDDFYPDYLKPRNEQVKSEPEVKEIIKESISESFMN